MSDKIQSKKRQQRVRSSLKKKSNGRLRLSVFRSNHNIYAQIIDDSKGKTLVSASSLEVKGKEEKAKAKPKATSKTKPDYLKDISVLVDLLEDDTLTKEVFIKKIREKLK